uniref:NR LBD domain-containing protein n=1 Tax=Acrobeloides nanus TaxID=290746 RepID=A0A914CXY0_9BILA
MLCYKSYGKLGICLTNGAYHPYIEDARFLEREESLNVHFSHIEDLFVKIVKQMLELEMDFTEFLLIKAIVVFHEEPELSQIAFKIIFMARNRYIKELYKHIKTKEKDASKSLERMSKLLMLLAGFSVSFI